MGIAKENVKERIALILRELGIEWVRRFEERDPQFLSISRLCNGLNNDIGVTLRLTVLNALISYQLTGKGEDHWDYFANYFIRNRPSDLCNDFIGYVMNSKYLARYRSSRIRRIRNACPRLTNLDAGKYLHDLTSLWRFLSSVVNAHGNEKTVVFAVKIAYYVDRACGLDVNVPMDIPIPVDYRVTVITICSGLIPIASNSLNARQLAGEIMVRRRQEIQDVWNEVGRLSGIPPPLNLDSVIWVLGGLLINSSFEMNKAINGLSGLGIRDKRVNELLYLLGGRCINR